MKKIKPSFIPGITWLIISTVLLTLPGSAFPTENWLGKIWFDKWVHIGMFSIMVVLWCWGLLKLNFDTRGMKKNFILISVVWLLYGIGMEFIQKHFVINRSFDTGDIIADGAGCLAGLIFSLSRYIKK